MLKIFTLSWQGKDKLEKIYDSLMISLNSINFEWYIKDNGSKDNTINLEKTWNNNKIHIISYPHNKDNFSYGCNFLYKEAIPRSDDLILLLNNDIIFNDAQSISNMIELLLNDDNIGVVGSRLLYPNSNRLQHSGVVFVSGYKTPTNYRSGEISDELSRRNREFQGVTGACWLTKAKYYENICRTNRSKQYGLDENLIWCFEDIDGCLSIKYNMDKKIVYCGSTNISHEESASLKKNPVNKLFLNHNLGYFLNKWKGRYEIDYEAYTKDKNKGLYTPPKVSS
jgi:GT2 family glycosyltransferase